MKRILPYFIQSTLLIAIAVGGLTSCGMVNIDLDTMTDTAVELKLGRDTLYIMEGENYVFKPTFTPDTIANIQVFYLSEADSVAHITGDTLQARSQGWSLVTAISVSGRQPDSCRVCVLPQWESSARVYPYETVVYAYVTVGGAPMTDDMTVAAFCEGEVRAIGQTFKTNGIQYIRFRVGSTLGEEAGQTTSGEEPVHDEEDPTEDNDIPEELYRESIYFRCYDHSRFNLYATPTTFTFDGETHGAPSNLIELRF